MSTKESNPKDEAAAGTRIDMTLFPQTAVVYGCIAMTEGHLKYGAYNWRVAGVKSSVYLAACRRHLAKWEAGQEFDPKTKVHHLANALSCIGIAIDAQECGMLIDDRPPKVPDIDEVFDMAERAVKHLHEVFPPANSPGRYTEEGKREKKTNSTSDPVHHSASSWGMFSHSGGD